MYPDVSVEFNYDEFNRDLNELEDDIRTKARFGTHTRTHPPLTTRDVWVFGGGSQRALSSRTFEDVVAIGEPCPRPTPCACARIHVKPLHSIPARVGVLLVCNSFGKYQNISLTVRVSL